jgi:putative transposase
VNRELRRANAILKLASFPPGGARPPTEVMSEFIDQHRDCFGVERICKVLPVSPSTYFAHEARRADPILRSDRVKLDGRCAPRSVTREHRARWIMSIGS